MLFHSEFLLVANGTREIKLGRNDIVSMRLNRPVGVSVLPTFKRCVFQPCFRVPKNLFFRDWDA